MSYFSNFGRLLYRLDDYDIDITKAELTTNILQRSVFIKDVIDNVAISYKYVTKDFDKPEIISHKLYGTTNRNWIVLLFNGIQNPYYDLAIDRISLEKYIMNKYNFTNIDTSKETLHHYEKRVTKQIYEYGAVQTTTTEKFTVNDKIVNYDTGAITARTLPVDSETPLSVPEENYDVTFEDGTRIISNTMLHFVSVYEYENEVNESKREIKLLDKSYIPLVEKQFKSLMSDG